MTEPITLPFLFDDPDRSARPQIQSPEPLPMTPEEVKARGWNEVDVVFITGDAYVDAPSFANGLLARLLEADGFRVAILSQPNWKSAEDFRKFGKPKLAFCVSAGNMDSMLNHYTANRKVRNDDAYTPGGLIGKRPDRATMVYCQRAREAFSDVPILAGGVEASLRRIAHYDYWSDKVRRPIICDAKADLLLYGMGERSILEVMRRLAKGESVETIRDVRGTVYRLGLKDDLPEEDAQYKYLPSYEEVSEDSKLGRLRFVKMTQIAYEHLNPYCAQTLVQQFGEEAIVVNPPSYPLTTEEMDAVYELPYTRKAHPSYKEPIPAAKVVANTIQTHRGCFGGCSFCAITAHQGKFIQTRSEKSIVGEIAKLANEHGGNYVVSDLNAPTANMYGLSGKKPQACHNCRRTSCLCPTICANLNKDHSAYIKLLEAVRTIAGVKQAFVASGIRTDLAKFSPEFVRTLAAHHTGGRLKTAPEHVDNYVLRLMNKPPIEDHEAFCELFTQQSRAVGKEQYTTPYLISGFPGCTLKAMANVACYLKAHDIRPEQVQDFIPAPFALATCMYYAGIDPETEEEVYVPRSARERRLQHALLFYYDPRYYHDVKIALREAGREDLIGEGPEALIAPYTTRDVAMRRSGQVNRHLKTRGREDEARMARQNEIANFDRDEEEEERQGWGRRSSRGGVQRSGGYRNSARLYGAAASTFDPTHDAQGRVWNPVEKKWEREIKPESQREAERGDTRRGGGERSGDDKGRRRFDNDRREQGGRFQKGRRPERSNDAGDFDSKEGFRRRDRFTGARFQEDAHSGGAHGREAGAGERGGASRAPSKGGQRAGGTWKRDGKGRDGGKPFVKKFNSGNKYGKGGGKKSGGGKG
ncbi:MAG: YgiQ family radical SAM protein [Planctomycetia bacterium]|nr:YgiQ family radical SAM protein [Planctomycetia bacterium]